LARVSRRFGWREQTDPTPQQATQFLGTHLYDRPLLLVVDNLPANADVTHVPIPGGKCRTLVTSRSMSLADDLGVPAATIRLEHWPPATSRQYLRDVVPRLAKEPDADLNALSGFVDGLPLAIRLLARALLNNVSRSAKGHLALLRAQPLGTLDKFAAGPDRGVAATFLEAYGGLSADEQKVLRALAACAQGTRAEIVATVAGLDAATAKEALDALYRVSLSEFRAGGTAPWGLHDVLRMFVAAQPGSKGVSAAHLIWVREHQRQHSDPLAHVEREEGITEVVAAFERLLAAGENGQASEVLDPVYDHLTRYGRYAQVVDLTERLLASPGGGDIGIAGAWLGNLGNCYKTLGDIPKAIDLHQRALAMKEKLGDLDGQAFGLASLGNCYRTLGDIPKAIDLHQRALAMHEKLGHLSGQASDLGNLGNCYGTLGDIPKAIDFLQRSLAIDEKLRRLEGQAIQLGNLGCCYATLGDIPKAVDFHQRALAMNEKLGILEGQARALGNLGNCYKTLGDIPKVIDSFQHSLALLRKMGLPENHPHVVMLQKMLAAAGLLRRFPAWIFRWVFSLITSLRRARAHWRRIHERKRK
jgi:tetratricopeptide (TPR) repeat protein